MVHFITSQNKIQSKVWEFTHRPRSDDHESLGFILAVSYNASFGKIACLAPEQELQAT